jgi:hypothetical protein
MKKLVAALCLMASTTCLAQSPGAKILVLDREQGEKRVRRPREKVPNPTSEFILKVTPQNRARSILSLERKRFLLAARFLSIGTSDKMKSCFCKPVAHALA